MSIVSHLLIQSSDRMSGMADNFVIKIPPLMGVGQVSLLSASIPNTLYTISLLQTTQFTGPGAVLSLQLFPQVHTL
jgi:hypothetical protein